MKKTGIPLPGYSISKDGEIIKKQIHKSVSARIASRNNPPTRYVRGMQCQTQANTAGPKSEKR